MDKIKFVMTNTSDIVTEVCREALEAKGVTVMVCDKNGTAALETLLAVHPQACLLDAFMPDLDAITVKQRYEERKRTAAAYIPPSLSPARSRAKKSSRTS